jgi:hypothetical protein
MVDGAAVPAPGAAFSLRCCCLRNKAMYLDFEPDPTIPGTRDGFFWCRHTMTVLGPDGQVADEMSCRAGRGCYETL